MAYKICSNCKTQNGVRTFVCKQCGTAFEKKEVKEVEKKVVVETPVDTLSDVAEKTVEEGAKQFQFKAYSGAENVVGTVQKRKTYERPDVEIERLMKDPEVMKIYPVPAGVQPYKPTKREKAYQVLGLGKDRAKSLLTVAQMENCWKDTDWKYVAEILGEKVIETVEPEPEQGE